MSKETKRRTRRVAPISESERWLEEKAALDAREEARSRYLQQLLSIRLTESDTFFLLDRPDERLPNIAPYNEVVTAANARFDALLAEKERAPPERFVGRGAQTLTAPPQSKECGTTTQLLTSTAAQAVGWAIDDEIADIEAAEDAEVDEPGDREDPDGGADGDGASEGGSGSSSSGGDDADGDMDVEEASTADPANSTTAADSSNQVGDTVNDTTVTSETQTQTQTHQQSTSAAVGGTSGKGSTKGAKRVPRAWRRSATLPSVVAQVEMAVMEAVVVPELLRMHGLADVLREADISPVGPLRAADSELDAIDAAQADVPPPGPLGLRGALAVDTDLIGGDDERSSRARHAAGGIGATAVYADDGDAAANGDDAPAARTTTTLSAMLRLPPAAAVAHLEVQEMTWHAVDRDLLAVGYGVPLSAAALSPLAPNVPNGGIATYHMANPTTPSRLIPVMQAAVTSVAFSKTRPSVIAACRSDGVVALYDLRSASSSPVLSSTTSASDHSGAAWACRWSPTALDSDEGLTSVGADGVVMQWHIRKGLEGRVAMRIKPQAASAAAHAAIGAAGGERLLSRLAGGLCLDFSPTERNSYVVGTEDGTIHKCSATYSEQFLFDYVGHRGPVYGVKWNPLEPDLFLSCGVDWTVRLWRQHKSEPVASYRAAPAAVLACAWSHAHPRIFGAVSAPSFQLWHTDHPLAPVGIYHASAQHASFRTVLFPHHAQSPVVLVGDSKGSVTVLDAAAATQSSS